MKKLLLIILTLPVSDAIRAQKAESPEKKYVLTASEFIFSQGRLTAGNIKIDPILRFSAFFNFQSQAHFDFSPRMGLYTGIGCRNVGFINKLNDSIRIKQRSYSLGIPLALKFGSMNKKIWIACGTEAELMFAYKQKVFFGGEKFKNYEWLSDKVNLFNPSLFVEIKFKEGTYLRAKYYLKDFLQKDRQEIRLFGDRYEFIPEESRLFYISIGSAVEPKKAKRKKGRINRTTIT
jgi:hypothetical protein